MSTARDLAYFIAVRLRAANAFAGDDPCICSREPGGVCGGVPSCPEFIRRDVAVKWKFLEDYTPAEPEPRTDQELHARCAHPEWEYATREGQRKAFDDYDVPPWSEELGGPDPSWERNWDAGRPGEGWDRFDYTEESYWRRRLPADQVREPYVPKILKLLAQPFAGQNGWQEAWRV